MKRVAPRQCRHLLVIFQCHYRGLNAREESLNRLLKRSDCAGSAHFCCDAAIFGQDDDRAPKPGFAAGRRKGSKRLVCHAKSALVPQLGQIPLAGSVTERSRRAFVAKQARLWRGGA
jgi:hypothetical protein